MKLPGLIDPHVHLREPGATHKEDWSTGTAAALAGGFTCVLAMPNTNPPISNQEVLEATLNIAQQKARCDYGQYLGAGPDNVGALQGAAQRSAGLKMYLDQTYGLLRLDAMTLWMEHVAQWPSHFPIVAHAEQATLASIILIASLFDRPIHLAHVSTRDEILLIRKAKEKGLPVTCEVTPHHLFLSQEDIPRLGQGRSEVRPRLATPADRQALWDNLEVIDCFATDHAPHTLTEKDSPTPPPGFPGLESAVPLLLTAVAEGKLNLDDMILRMATNPRRIFHIPEQPETWVEVDLQAECELRAAANYTQCGWTPFEGRKVTGRVQRVVLRGVEVFRDGKVLAPEGFGRNIRDSG